MQKWRTHFKDRLHDAYIEIVNTEEDYSKDPISFTLDGVTFKGGGIGDFAPIESDIQRACERFNILKSGGFEMGGEDVPYWYELQRYSLETEIPVTVVRGADGGEVQGSLHISFEYTEHDPEKTQAQYYLGDERVYHDDMRVDDFSLTVEGERFASGRKTLCFESALIDICSQIKDRYYLKCCLTCQYSDYSPYGNDDFGTMQCFIRQKENYLKVNSKPDYFEHLNTGHGDYELRQETYLCGSYEIRNRCEGYRGLVPL